MPGNRNPLGATLVSLILALAVAAAMPTRAQDSKASVDLRQLLESVREGRAYDRQDNAERLQRFRSDQAEQGRLLTETQTRRAELEAISADMETRFEANEETLSELGTRLQERMGSLKELFGVLQQVASDTQALLSTSLTELEHDGRSDFLVDFAGRMGQASRLPEISEIERLWFELLQEMTESGRVVTGNHPVVTGDGVEVTKPVTRIGVFNAVSDGRFLKYIPETGRLVEYGRQPSARYLTGITRLADGDSGMTPVAIDPVRGQLLDVLTQAPNLSERVDQGGVIGYVIIGMGVLGILLALTRLTILLLKGRAMTQQLRHLDTPSDKNPLGRVILAAGADDVPDLETLELRMGEAVLREVPPINAWIPLLKIIAAVAPLMGLLGTVTGMILTFQAITLFGAGDPRLMAGGISQALITTVLGLTVAIPMLLLHNLVNMRARSLTEILQHWAVALVADRAEREADKRLATQAEAA